MRFLLSTGLLIALVMGGLTGRQLMLCARTARPLRELGKWC